MKDQIIRIKDNLTPSQRIQIQKFIDGNMIVSCVAFINASINMKNTIIFPIKSVRTVEIHSITCNICFERILEKHDGNYDTILAIDDKYELGIWSHLLQYHPELFT